TFIICVHASPRDRSTGYSDTLPSCSLTAESIRMHVRTSYHPGARLSAACTFISCVHVYHLRARLSSACTLHREIVPPATAILSRRAPSPPSPFVCTYVRLIIPVHVYQLRARLSAAFPFIICVHVYHLRARFTERSFHRLQRYSPVVLPHRRVHSYARTYVLSSRCTFISCVHVYQLRSRLSSACTFIICVHASPRDRSTGYSDTLPS